MHVVWHQSHVSSIFMQNSPQFNFKIEFTLLEIGKFGTGDFYPPFIPSLSFELFLSLNYSSPKLHNYIYIYIYIYIYTHTYINIERDENSNANSFSITNVKTVENAPRDIFTLNNHVLFKVNITSFNVIQSE